MFSFFRQKFRQWARSGPRTGAQRKPVRRRLECESLEDRLLPSLSTSEILINTTRLGVEKQPAVATSSNGSSVVVWTQVRDSLNSDIKAQRFDSSGHKVGSEITITSGRGRKYDPVVGMDSHGDFVVAWVFDYTATDQDIHAAVFRADGTRLVSDVKVASWYLPERDPSIAVAADGHFVVSYTYQFNSSDADVKASLFTFSGSKVRSIDVASTTKVENQARVAMAPDGRFAIAYHSQEDIYLQRFDKYGSRLSTQAVANTSRLERNPTVAMDSKGNTLVGWQESNGGNWNILARSITSGGVLGSVGTVQATSAQETLPSVAVDSSTGKFVVAYQSQVSTTTSVKVTEMSATGSVIRTSTVGTGLYDPQVSLGGIYHRYFVVDQSLGSHGLDTDGGIFGRFGIL